MFISPGWYHKECGSARALSGTRALCAVSMLFVVRVLFKVTATEVEEPMVDVGAVESKLILQCRGPFYQDRSLKQSLPFKMDL